MSLFPLFLHLVAMKWWDQMPWSLFSECWVFSQLFLSPLSLSSRGSLVPLHFFPQGWCHLHIRGYWYFFWQSWFCILLHIQPWHTPFPIWNQSIVPCLVLTVASWPVYRFLRKQLRWSGRNTRILSVCGKKLRFMQQWTLQM